jgi:peptide subunit release factor 1 (eRF1)
MSARPTGTPPHRRRFAKHGPEVSLPEQDEFLSVERVQRIESVSGGGLPIVSMYLGLAPEPGDVHASAVTKADSLLHEIRSLEADRGFDHDARMSLRGDIETIEEVVEQSASTPGALAIISCSGAGALEVVHLPRAVMRDRIMVDETPWVRPLLAVLEQHHRCLAVVVDREQAHAWELYVGQMRDCGALVRDSGAPSLRGSNERSAQHKEEEHEKHHFRRVAEALEGLLGSDRREVLALGGHENELPHFLEAMARPLRDRVAGTFAIDPAAARNAGTVRERAEAALERYELDQQRRSVANVLARSAAGEKAVVGLDACLWAGSVAGVESLYVQEGAIHPGVVCDRSRWLAASGELCPVCGAQLRETPDVIDELIETVIEEGGSVRQVRAETELGEQLVACALRFELPGPTL